MRAMLYQGGHAGAGGRGRVTVGHGMRWAGEQRTSATGQITRDDDGARLPPGQYLNNAPLDLALCAR